MNRIVRVINAIYITPVVLFGLLIVYSLFSRLLGPVAFALELFTAVSVPIFLTRPFLMIFVEKNRYKRIAFLLLGLAFVGFGLWARLPVQMAERFYYEANNHAIIAGLQAHDVSSIAVGDLVLTQPEQITEIVNILRSSQWYSPNHERRGTEVPMTVVLRNGQTMYFRLSRFSKEDNADLLFIRPRESGFWADGDALVPGLPSAIGRMGYSLP